MATLTARLTAKTNFGGIFRRRNGQRQSGKTNGALCFLGAVVTKNDETKPDIALCNYQENPAGILELLADNATLLSNDAEDPIADGINVRFTRPDNDDEFLACLGAGRGCTIEHIAVIDHDNPGYLEDMAGDNESIAAVPPFRIIGKFQETVTASAGEAQYAWVKGL